MKRALLAEEAHFSGRSDMQGKSKLEICVAIILAGWCFIIITSSVYYKMNSIPGKGQPAKRVVAGWRSLVIGRSLSLGVKGAKFVVIEFSDYQCPYCRVAEQQLQRFVRSHPGDVAVYRYDLPRIEVHKYALAAAVAADCAAMQGITETYQAALFTRQAEFSDLDWVGLARYAGVRDVNMFAHCISDQGPSNLITRDIAMSRALNISGTPTFIINGQVIEGLIPLEKLDQLYVDALTTDG
jgi:protein-disulfide isomerase